MALLVQREKGGLIGWELITTIGSLITCLKKVVVMYNEIFFIIIIRFLLVDGLY